METLVHLIYIYEFKGSIIFLTCSQINYFYYFILSDTFTENIFLF